MPGDILLADGMSYFFRKSLGFGPIRLNLSKSGIGASVGVKGARLTMTPRGTAYVTVGSHGFYYRETLSQRTRSPARTSASPTIVADPSPADEIVTADAADLVDSSSEALVQRLNERAKMFNPAWWFYAIAVAVSIGGLAMFSSAENPPVVTPPLPDVASPFDTERKGNTTDEYAMLVAHYGEPDSVLATQALGDVSVGTAHYGSANLKVLFVPNGCVETYDEVSRKAGAAKSKMRSVERCVPQPNAGWTIVGYRSATDSVAISPETAKAFLEKIAVKRASPPLVTSNAQASLAVANCWRELKTKGERRQEQRSTVPSRSDETLGPKARALKVLGLNGDASAEETSAAYRRMAQLYHPDKVAGLAPEFQALADIRMKEINLAYGVLKASPQGSASTQPTAPGA